MSFMTTLNIPGGSKMKRIILAVLVGGLLLSLAYAPLSYAEYYHGHHGSHGGYYTASAIVGGLLLGTMLGSAISQPRYAYPAPAYAYPSGGPAYVSEGPPGEWVLVPGRWVGGRWIPAHKAWAPINPY
jgi:hypothetical protein